MCIVNFQICSLVLLCLCFLPLGAKAEESEAERLKRLEAEIEALQLDQAERERERLAITEEMIELKRSLIETAGRIQDLEQSLLEIDQSLTSLLEEEHAAKMEMSRHRDQLYQLLGAMQALERQRPPALVTSPNDATNAVRSAILLNEIMPQMKARVDEVMEQVRELQELRRQIMAEQARKIQSEGALEGEKEQIQAFLTEKETRREELTEEAIEDQAKIRELATEASSLKTLIEKLKFRELAQQTQERDSSPLEDTNSIVELSSVSRHVARQSKNLPSRFSDALGKIPLPVAGAIKLEFGKENEFGEKSSGITIETRKFAQVVAPFTGRIVYAGPFLDFEQLLLIEAGEGYHIILTGMAEIFGAEGDSLLAGEPVGAMGASTARGSLDSGTEGPELYLEFRKNGDPINPRPWIVVEKRKVSG